MNFRQLFYHLLLFVGVAGLATHTAAATPRPQTTQLHFQPATSTTLQFTLETPAGQLDNGRYILPDLDTIQTPGTPGLPVYSRLVVLPPQADVSIHIEEADLVTWSGVQLEPNPAPELAPISATAVGAGVVDASLINAQLPMVVHPAYQTHALYPTASYTLSPPMYYRDVRLVRLQLYPARYNPIAQTLVQARQLHVTLTFSGSEGQLDQQTVVTANDPFLAGLATAVLNPKQLQQWRSLPPAVQNVPATALPVGQTAYKITVPADGIYQLTYQDLQAAGLAVNDVNPHTFAMLHRGEPVSYQFVGDSDDHFESDESVRFYGAAFSGPRAEKQYVAANIYWLWANGTPSILTSRANQAGEGYPVTSQLPTAVTREENIYYFSGWDTDWSQAPNEPDSYYWDYISHGVGGVTKSYTIDLPDLATTSGADAAYEIEITARRPTGTSFNYLVRGTMNSQVDYAEAAWTGSRNLNLNHTIPADQLTEQGNEVHLAFLTDTSQSIHDAEYYLNRVTVTYPRHLRATANELLFIDPSGGAREFRLAGFSENNAANVLVWDVSPRSVGDNGRQPIQISLNSGHIVPENGAFTYLVGSEHGANGRFIATTTANLRTPSAITAYQVNDLTPPGQQADWLTISHSNFMAAAQTLAAHRAQPVYGQHRTHIVNIDDVINQYGYGLNLPGAIQQFLTYALGHWSTAYVVLLGDGNINPLHYSCPTPPGTCGGWDPDEPNFIVTNFAYVDRFQGQIVSDHPYTLLSGSDLLADLALGRISANTAAQANAAVAKIIRYEQEVRAKAAWSKHLLFVADNDDSNAGFFCADNALTGTHVDPTWPQTHLCFDEDAIDPVTQQPTPEQTAVLVQAMSDEINGAGSAIVNYRGHGGRNFWAGPTAIMSTNNVAFWQNDGRPVIILAADCLDGYFGWPGVPSLSETLFTLSSVGSAGHWSSSGLGFTYEHSVLHVAFYDALFDIGLPTFGNAVNYAKLKYYEGGYHESEIYSFTLQGDPALRLYFKEYQLSLPIIRRP